MTQKLKPYERGRPLKMEPMKLIMVINIGAMKSGNIKMVEDDLRSIKRACRQTTISKLLLKPFF